MVFVFMVISHLKRIVSIIIGNSQNYAMVYLPLLQRSGDFITLFHCSEPLVDAKYLAPSSGPAPAPLKTRNWMTSPADPLLPPVKTRISKEHVNPHNALATAYFPKQKWSLMRPGDYDCVLWHCSASVLAV